jgi:hypothetical protein
MAALYEGVDYFALLINGSPQILIATINLQVNLIQMPGIANWASTLFKALRSLGTELLAPCSNRLVAHNDALLEHHFVNIPIVQAVTEIQPHTTANNLNWVTMARIVSGKFHGIIPIQTASHDNAVLRSKPKASSNLTRRDPERGDTDRPKNRPECLSSKRLTNLAWGTDENLGHFFQIMTEFLHGFQEFCTFIRVSSE